MRYKRHLFISYTHKDNEPVIAGTDGWVSRFHKTLGAVLAMRLGYVPDIWRDERLQGNDVFTPEIKQQLPETAILLAVVSQGYVRSAWCRDEAQTFCDVAQQAGSMTVQNKSRVFKVVKSPPSTLDPLPAVMREMVGYNFFERNADNAPQEFDPELMGSESRSKYVERINTLAFNLQTLIDSLDADAANDQATSGAADTKPAVYLAECGEDRLTDRNALANNLLARGYRLLPDRELPRGEVAYRQAVQDALANCALAIHLVGNHSGWTPDGPSQCAGVELQNALSAERSRQGGLRRVVSVPDGLVGAEGDERQQRFIHALHNDVRVQGGALNTLVDEVDKLITGDLEAVKMAVLNTLADLEKPPAPPAPPAAAKGEQVVYLVCDRRDAAAAEPLRALLVAQGCKVRLPAFAPDATRARKEHEDRLAKCDAVVIYHGAGTKDWYDSVLVDVTKAPSLRQGRPIANVFTWLGAEETFEKSARAYSGEAGVVNGLDGFDAALAQPLLDALGVATHG